MTIPTKYWIVLLNLNVGETTKRVSTEFIERQNKDA